MTLINFFFVRYLSLCLLIAVANGKVILLSSTGLNPRNHYWKQGMETPGDPHPPCGVLPSIENGRICQGSWTFGSRREIVCDIGFSYDNKDNFLTCSFGGHWRHVGKCIRDFNSAAFYPVQSPPTTMSPFFHSFNNGLYSRKDPNYSSRKEKDDHFHTIATAIFIVSGIVILIMGGLLARPFIMEDCLGYL